MPEHQGAGFGDAPMDSPPRQSHAHLGCRHGTRLRLSHSTGAGRACSSGLGGKGLLEVLLQASAEAGNWAVSALRPSVTGARAHASVLRRALAPGMPVSRADLSCGILQAAALLGSPASWCCFCHSVAYVGMET